MIPTVRSDLSISLRPSGDGFLVYDPATDTGHVLEGVTALVFDALRQPMERSDLLRIVGATSGVDADARVDAALAQLAEAGLLDGEYAPTTGVSRRALIGGLAVGAAGVALIPMLTSIASPRPAGAQQPMTVDPKSATTPEVTPVDVTLTAHGLTTADTVYWAVTQPAHGTVVVTNTSSGGANTGAYATYTPNPGFTGVDTFTYTAGECAAAVGTIYPAPQYAVDACPAGTTISGSGITPATVTITVTPAPTTTTTAPAPVTPKVTG